MTERAPIAPSTSEPEAEPEKPKSPPMKVWLLKALAEDPEVQQALATLVRENDDVRRAIRVICIEDILAVADKAPPTAPMEDATFLNLARTYIRPEAIRSPYGR